MSGHQPLQEKAYMVLLDMIQKGSFSRNVIYSETKLAAQLGLSRTPVKDALVRLSQDKYVDILPSKGFCLHIMSEEDIWNTFQARTAVEGFCAIYLCQRKDTPEGTDAIRSMERLLDGHADAVRQGADPSVILEYDLQFHELLVMFCQNPELIQLYATYRHQLSDTAIKSFDIPGRCEKAYHEHYQIYQSILQPHQEMEAYKAVMHHMEVTREIALSIFAAEE